MQDVFVVLVCFEQLNHQHQQQKDLNLLTSARCFFKSENYFKMHCGAIPPAGVKAGLEKGGKKMMEEEGRKGERGGVGKRTGMVKEGRRGKGK